MSQHHVVSEYKNRPVRVVTGWDRPLRYFFMTINWEDIPEDDENCLYVYSNLTDPSALTNTQDVNYFIELLEQLEVPTPAEMWDQIVIESELGGSNRVVHYELDGAIISDSSQGT
jgi:hypothetical protein